MPSGIAPARFTSSTTAQSFSGTRSLNNSDPCVVRTPPVICESFIAMGSPVQRPQLIAPHDCRFRLRGELHGIVPCHQEEGVELCVQPVDASQECFDEFYRRNLLRANKVHELSGRSGCELVTQCDFSLIVRRTGALLDL